MAGPPPSQSKRQPIDEGLFEAIRGVVAEARSAYVRHVEGGGRVRNLDRVFAYDEFNSGLPHVRQDFESTIPDYGAPFGPAPGEWNPIPYGEWDSFKRYLELLNTHEGLRKTSYFLNLFPDKEGAEETYRLETGSLPFDIFARLMHLYGADFDDDHLREVYCELEAARLSPQLAISMMVPIVCTRIVPAEVEIAPGIRVVEIARDLQIARVSPFDNPTSPVNEVVAMAATHALVFEGESMANREGSSDAPYARPDFYPLETIDRFFSALRAVTGLQTGYANLYLLPQGWARHFDRDLPVVISGAAIRRYPPQFDHYGWLGEKIAVTAEQLEETAAVFEALAVRERLALAASRLSTAMLHESEEDAILDLIIGLEAALGDDGRSEMTHKLALRCAAVLASRGEGPGEVFNRVKTLYNYRSAVAHGDGKTAKKHITITSGDGRIGSSVLATIYLREVIRALAMRPDLDDGKDVDTKILLAALSAGEA